MKEQSVGFSRRRVSVVVPVYSQLELLEKLFCSLERTIPLSRSGYFSELLVVNDNPSNTLVTDYLDRRIQGLPFAVRVIRNSENIGFVGSMNRAMNSACPENDVLMLNSDTVVYDHWIDDFFDAVELLEKNGTKWGSLTPVTNSGTIATIPRIGEEYNHFVGQNAPEKIATICHRLFSGKNALLSIPVGVGFCMLLNRVALDEVGLFLEIFSPGYGEETEWCLRATKHGFLHFLLPSVFVYHAGGSSFAETRVPLRERASRIVGEMYPDYEASVRRFIESPENHKYQQMVAPYVEFLSLLKHRRLAIHLLHADLHQTVGGVEKYVEEVTRYADEQLQISSLIVYPAKRAFALDVEVYIDGAHYLSLSFETLHWILSFLARCGVVSIESLTLQHAMNWDVDRLTVLCRMLGSLTTKRTAVVHDYYFLCPQHNLLWNDSEFCGAPVQTETSRCASCSYGTVVKDHREKCAKLLSLFSHFVCPSETARKLFMKIYPELRDYSAVEPHYHLAEPALFVARSPGKRVSLVFLGAMGKNKGIARFEKLIEQFGRKFPWVTIGIEDRFKTNSLVKHFSYSFRDGTDLSSILSLIRPAFLVMGSITPETFSFTAYEALQAGIPILTTEESGNIAALVKHTGAGLVFKNFDEMVRFLSRPAAELLTQVDNLSKQIGVSLNRTAVENIYRSALR